MSASSRGERRGFHAVTTIPLFSEAVMRGARMLRTALGPAIARYLEDPGVVEVMLNPDGRLWIDRLSGGLEDTGVAASRRLMPSASSGWSRITSASRFTCNGAPRVSAELPGTGERFEGLLPPVVAAPCFAIRRPAVAVFTSDDYIAACVMTHEQARRLRLAPCTSARTSSSPEAPPPARPPWSTPC